MRPVFADTSFWIAAFDARDAWHESATRTRARLQGRRMVTTDAVAAEFLNLVCDRPAWVRERAAALARWIWRDDTVEAVPGGTRRR